MQPVDARLVGQKPRLGSADVFPQRASGLAAFAQFRTGRVEFALVDQCRGPRPDRGEFWPVISQPSKVGAKLDQFLGRPIKASRDIGETRVCLAQLLQDFAKRRFLDAFLLRNGAQDFLLTRHLFAMPTLDVFLAQACTDRAVYDAPGGGDAAARRLNPQQQSAQPVEHGRASSFRLESFF